MKKKHYTFEEDYFEGYYIHEITDFTPAGFNRMYKWFRGIFSTLDKYVDIEDGKGKRAIEFGCAIGAVSKVLSDLGYDVLGTDVSSYAVKRASKLAPEIKFSVHDIQKPFKKKEKFDLVCAFDVIEHLKVPEKAIRNMFSIVKDNGVVICSTPNDYEYARKVPSHINVKKPEEWEKIFKKVGFKNVRIRQLSFLPFFYRLDWRLNFAVPFGINFEAIPSPVFIIAKK